MPHLVVGITWVTGIICGTYLIVHDHPFYGIAVATLGMLANATTGKEK